MSFGAASLASPFPYRIVRGSEMVKKGGKIPAHHKVIKLSLTIAYLLDMSTTQCSTVIDQSSSSPLALIVERERVLAIISLTQVLTLSALVDQTGALFLLRKMRPSLLTLTPSLSMCMTGLARAKVSVE